MRNQRHQHNAPLSFEETLKQEAASSVSHAVAAVISLAAFILLVGAAAQQGSLISVFSSAIFGGSLIVLFTASTLLHGLPKGPVRKIFETMDLAGIFLVIAGTYTPLALVAIGGWLGWALFIAVWAMAAGGTAFMIVSRRRFEKVAWRVYLLMGWLIAVAIRPLAEALGPVGLGLLIGGGLAYSIGIVFFIWHRFYYHHAIWHGFVILGSVLHFLAVLLYTLPVRHPF